MGAMEIGTGLAQGVINTIGGNTQMDRQKDIMDIQQKNQMELNEHGAGLQYDMWKKTSYPAQMEMMKQAGLNPALMYGQGGGAGGTTGSQSGGSAQGGNAPQAQHMDISSIMQLSKLNAEKKNIEADTALKEKEAGYKGSATTGQDLSNEWSKLSQSDRVDFEKWKTMKELAGAQKEGIEANIAINTEKDIIQKIKDEAKLPEKQAEEITARIWKMKQDVAQGNRKLDLEQFANELKSEYPSIQQVMGKGANEITMWLQNILGKVIGEENTSNYRKVK